MAEICPATGAVGAEISGIDLSAINDADFRLLRDALDQYLVIRLRDQQLDRFQLSSLAREFGPHFIHPIVDSGLEDCPEVLQILREPEDQYMFGGECWHADVSWMKPAGYASILHALEIPDNGGDTCFSSTIAAFASLSPACQDMLRSLNAVHSYYWYERREQSPWVVEHPVVRKHPATGAEGLYVNRMFTSRFAGMTEQESAPMLNFLFDHMQAQDFCCRFRWQVGDVLIWDNRFCLHYPVNDFSGQRRRMIRTSTLEA